mmetsp:Transcript_34683/g.46519  ORF Transcript_34683/g.46519 Transcript_34683/m.46519 type:complete len:123 (+) Transcript_34683:1048-1416(+)
MNIVLGDLGIPQHLLARVHALLEVVHAEILETSTGDGRVEVDSIKERVNLNVCLSRTRQSTLSTFARGTETAKRPLVLGHILAVTTLEVLQEVVNHAVVEILSTQVGVSSSSLDLENTLLNG